MNWKLLATFVLAAVGIASAADRPQGPRRAYYQGIHRPSRKTRGNYVLEKTLPVRFVPMTGKALTEVKP